MNTPEPKRRFRQLMISYQLSGTLITFYPTRGAAFRGYVIFVDPKEDVCTITNAETNENVRVWFVTIIAIDKENRPFLSLSSRPPRGYS